MFNSKIAAFSKYVPEKIVTNNDLSEIVDTSDEWIFSRTGIKERRVSTSENTSEVCAKAAEASIIKAGVSPDEIELIITATMTPDYSSPSTACIIQKLIGAKKAVSFDLSAACSGFVFALCAADKFIKTLLLLAERLRRKLSTGLTGEHACFSETGQGRALSNREKAGVLSPRICTATERGLILSLPYTLL